MTCRHATSRAQRHSAHSTACRAVWLYAPWLPEPCPAATGGCGFTIETGSESAIGITQPLSGSFSLALRAMAPLQRPVIEAERQSTQILSTHWRRRQKEPRSRRLRFATKELAGIVVLLNSAS